MLFLARAVAPEHSAASAQALYAGLATGLAMGGATILAGALFEATSPAAAFLAMAFLSAAGGLGTLVLARCPPEIGRRTERGG